MRRVQPTGRIESMLIHPSIHLDLAHERQRELIARAERQRLAEASRRAALPQQGSVARSAPQQEAETLMKNILSEPHPPGHAPPRELAFRSVDGLEVTLLWNADEDRLTVSVYDPAVPEFFEVPAPSDRALDVFYHPYAYAAQRGIEYGASVIEIEDTADV
jgi:hypothetical protein